MSKKLALVGRYIIVARKYTLTALMLVIALCLPVSMHVGWSNESPATVDVADDVATTLAQKSSADVIVTLADYTTDSLKTSGERANLAEDIDGVADDADLSDSDTREFSRLPIIATTIDSGQLDDLRNDNRVASIRLRQRYSVEDFAESRSGIVNLESVAQRFDVAKPLLNQVIPLVEADDAWNATTPFTGDGERIVIIDTGVDKNHPFLSGAVVAERCYAQGPNGIGGSGSCPNGQDSQTGTGAAAPCTTNSSCGHGTHVAGIAAGRRNVSGAPTGGVAPDASIVAIQVFGTYTGGACDGPSPCVMAEDTDIYSALQWVLANPTDVASINMSLGGGEFTSSCDSIDPSTASALQTLATTYKIATVVASGNSGSSTIVGWPACFSYSIAVGSTTKSDVVSSFTDSNSLIRLWAPGSSVRSSVPTTWDTDGVVDGYSTKSGTSMAAPVVSGALAVLKEAYPTESWSSLLTRLQNSGVDITDSRNGVTRSRISVIDALDLEEPALPASPGYASLVAYAGYANLSWGASGDATQYRIYNANNVLINTVSSSTTNVNVATTYNVSTHFSVAAVNAIGESTRRTSNSVVGKPSSSQIGYAFFASNGAVVGTGVYAPYSRGPIPLFRPVVGGATSAQLNGGWAVAGDGGIFTFGNAPFFGSIGGKQLNKPIVSMSSTPTGNGYWFVAADGGIFSFGDAQFYGSMGGQRLFEPVVGMASTPSGHGYWLTASDGGIFSFGDAQFYGSVGGKRLNQPVVGMASTPSGHGYWFVAADGGIFSFGDAQFFGSMGGQHLNKPITSMKATYTGNGYWLFAADGSVYSFGDAAYYGAATGYGYAYGGAG